MNDAEARLDELVAIAAPYWAGEAEIVQIYFSGPRSRENDVRWLRAQCWKEIYGQLEGDPGGVIEGPIERLRESFPPVGQAARRRFLHIAEELYEEFHHYAMLADILDDLEGRPIPPDELEQLPEDVKLTRMRGQNRDREGALGLFANKFCEGGGSSMYRAASTVAGGDLEQRIAAAFSRIAGDEIDHMKTGAEGLRSLVQTEEQWDKVKRMVRDLSRQRVRMRNEMFGFPLSEERLQEIDEGNIQPVNRDILKS